MYYMYMFSLFGEDIPWEWSATDEHSKYLPAVSKTVNQKVETAVDAHQQMSNYENLRANRNKLKITREEFIHSF